MPVFTACKLKINWQKGIFFLKNKWCWWDKFHAKAQRIKAFDTIIRRK